MSRLRHVPDLINRLLGGYSPVVRVTEHYVGEEGIGYLSVRISIPHADMVAMMREH